MTAVDGRMTTAFYGVNPYRIPYRSAYIPSFDGTGTAAVIRMPLSRQYGDGVQPYMQCGYLLSQCLLLFDQHGEHHQGSCNSLSL